MKRLVSLLARNLLERLVRHRGFRGRGRLITFLMRLTPIARSVYGPDLLCDPKDYTNRACIIGRYGDELSGLIRSLPQDSVFLDFGANAGLFSLIAGRHLSHGKVFSFEPSRRTFSKLVRNIEINRAYRVTALNFGVATTSKLVRFSVSEVHTGGGHVSDLGEDSILLLDARSVVDVLQINDSRSGLCKIDTEGSELMTVRALAESGILTGIQTLYVEIDARNLNRMGDSVDELYEFLLLRGYEPTTDRRGLPHYDEIFRRV